MYVATDGVFKLRGGSVTGNSADSDGGGVYVDGGSFIVSGSPTVTGNTDSTQNQSNVYLNTGSVISLDEPLTRDASFGIGAAYEGRFTDDSYNRYTHSGSPFTADSLYRLYQDADGNPCIEPAAHHPAAPEWTWSDNLTTAEATMYCKNCGQVIWTASDIPVTFEYDTTEEKLYANASVEHDSKSYLGRLELHPLRVEEQEPRIDENKVYHSGTKAHYKLNVVNATYYFTEVDGHPGEQCELSALALDTFTFTFAEKNGAWGIAAYTGDFDAEEIYIELPGWIENPENPDDPVEAFELSFLGDGENPFYTLPETMLAAPPEVVITDKGTITGISAAAFAGKQNLILQLRAEDKSISIADGAFTDCVDVKIQANSASGLEARTYDDSTGKYTVELVDMVHYTATAAWKDDYSSAKITISGDNGETYTFPAKRITRAETETEDPQTHEITYTLSITAEGTFEGNQYSVTLENVPFFNVTVEKMAGTLRLPCARNTDNTGFADYAVFYVKQDMLDPLNPPAGAALAGLTDDIEIYNADERVEIRSDTNFTASWCSTWAAPTPERSVPSTSIP